MRRTSIHLNAAAAPQASLVDVVDVILGRLDSLAQEVANLQSSVGALRREGGGRGAAPVNGRRRAATSVATTPRATTSRAVTPRAAAARAATKGAATKGAAAPRAATPRAAGASPLTRTAVTAAIGRLGHPTAAEIAASLSTRTVPISGRAVRWVAEAAGATVTAGPDGKRRYSVR